jgi:hypothetical protein
MTSHWDGREAVLLQRQITCTDNVFQHADRGCNNQEKVAPIVSRCPVPDKSARLTPLTCTGLFDWQTILAARTTKSCLRP